MFRKSVRYILTFHMPQIMREAWGGMNPLYFYKSFSVFLFGALLSFNI